MFFWLLVLLTGTVVTTALVAYGVYYWHRKGRDVETQLNRQQLSAEYLQAREKLQREQLEAEHRLLENDARFTLARNRQDETLTTVRLAITNLEFICELSHGVSLRLTELHTNSIGARLSYYPELVRVAARIYSEAGKSLPAAAEVEQQLLSARRIEQTITDMLGKPYNPTDTLFSSARNIYSFSKTNRENLALLVQQIAGLEKDLALKPAVWINPGVVHPTSAPTLAQAFSRLYDLDHPAPPSPTRYYAPPPVYHTVYIPRTKR